jgi:hypothetical protein
MGHRFVENGGGNVSGLFIFVQMKSNNNKKSVIQFFFQEINFILISRKKIHTTKGKLIDILCKVADFFQGHSNGFCSVHVRVH